MGTSQDPSPPELCPRIPAMSWWARAGYAVPPRLLGGTELGQWTVLFCVPQHRARASMRLPRRVASGVPALRLALIGDLQL